MGFQAIAPSTGVVPTLDGQLPITCEGANAQNELWHGLVRLYDVLEADYEVWAFLFAKTRGQN